MDKDLVMPQSAVSDLNKASQKELVEEIKTLRQFVGLMLLRLRGYVEGQELSEQQSIVARLDILEKKVVLYEPK